MTLSHEKLAKCFEVKPISSTVSDPFSLWDEQAISCTRLDVIEAKACYVRAIEILSCDEN